MHTPPTFYKGLKVDLKIQNAGQNEATRSRPAAGPANSASQMGAPGTAPGDPAIALAECRPWTCPGFMTTTTQGGKEAGPEDLRAAVVNETSPPYQALGMDQAQRLSLPP